MSPSSPAFTRSLFLRIFAAFVGTVLVFAISVALLVSAAFSSWNEGRVNALVERTTAADPTLGPALAEALLSDDHHRVVELVAALEAELDVHVSVLPHIRGRRFGPPIPPPRPHDPPPLLLEHPPSRAEAHRLRSGLPLVRRPRLGPPSIGIPLFADGFALDDADADADDIIDTPRGREPRQAFVALVWLTPQHNPQRGLIGTGLLLLLALGAGAFGIARSLTSRLAKLERSTQALAAGELSHRAELADEPRDEIDRLAISFNEMADRLEAVLTGQRTLLANVSHELRTPISRTKVLVEILGERLENMSDALGRGEAVAAEDIARLERGLTEMNQDLGEVEVLIRDLLTSGRLELAQDGALARELLDVRELCEGAAARFDATVDCEPGLELDGDRLLLERLLKNLLANARRACPDGTIVIRARRDGAQIVIEVEDEGPGVPFEERSHIFEPFARLDAARARDRGGVGLGLYLCRQIASAHGGVLKAFGRHDERSGARFELRLPAR